MNSVINDTMTSKEMLDILVAKNMEDAREGKRGASWYAGQAQLRLVNFVKPWAFIWCILKIMW